MSAKNEMLTAEWLPLGSFGQGDLDRWHELSRRAVEPNVFLEPVFARAVIANLKQKDVGAIVVRKGLRFAGLLAGRVEFLRCFRPLPTFVAWTHAFAPLSAPLIDRDCAQAVVTAFFDLLPELPGQPRLALFPLVNEQGEAAKLMAKNLSRAGRAICQLNPHRRAILILEHGNPLAFVSPKKRKELRRQRSRLAEEGLLTHETAGEADKIGAAVADYLALEAKGWKGRGGSAARSRLSAARLISEAVAGLAGEGKARADVLRLDGEAIAATITLFSGNRAWFWKTTYDESYARFSPGVLLALALTESLVRERNFDLVDSCAVASHPMIDHLWRERTAMADWLVPLGGEKSFLAGVAAEKMRRRLVSLLKALRGHLPR